jgi:hypothetical protein
LGKSKQNLLYFRLLTFVYFYPTVEDALTSLGMKLEYEHFRLGGALDELKPLLINTRSPSDTIMEAFEQLC